jgi:hypothetical protein
MQTRRWVIQGQPQTLQIAVFLLYINAAFALLAFLTDPLDEIALMLTDVRGLVHLALAAGLAGAGYLIANERKLGYPLGIAAAAFPIVIRLWAARRYHVDIIDLGMLFDVALVALLLHPQSREYQRSWFK